MSSVIPFKAPFCNDFLLLSNSGVCIVNMVELIFVILISPFFMEWHSLFSISFQSRQGGGFLGILACK